MAFSFVGIDTATGKMNPAAEAASHAIATEATRGIRHQARAGRFISFPSYWWASYYQENPNLDYWAQTLRRPDRVGFVIVNPNSGPSDATNPDWEIQSRIARHSGATVLGYVSTNYADAGPARAVGSRSHAVILDEIDRYVRWYRVEGVFLDEVSNGWNDAQANDHFWYQELTAKIRAAYGAEFVLVGNCGVNCRAEYLPLFDTVVTYENTAAGYLQASQDQLEPQHFAGQPRSKFWHMVHDVESPDQAQEILARAAELTVSHLYLTDDSNDHKPDAGEMWGNPYDVPPAAWLLEEQLRWAETQGDPNFYGNKDLNVAVDRGKVAAHSRATLEAVLTEADIAQNGPIILEDQVEVPADYILNFGSSIVDSGTANTGTKVLVLPWQNNNSSTGKPVHAYSRRGFAAKAGTKYRMHVNVRSTGGIGTDAAMNFIMAKPNGTNNPAYVGITARVKLSTLAVGTDWSSVMFEWTAPESVDYVVGVQAIFLTSDLQVDGPLRVRDASNLSDMSPAVAAARLQADQDSAAARDAWSKILPVGSVTAPTGGDQIVETVSIDRATYQALQAAGKLQPNVLYLVTA